MTLFLTKQMAVALIGIFLQGGAVQLKQRDSYTKRYWGLVQRMRYWHLADRAQPSTSKYLLFSIDVGATNNLRIAWEMTGVVARETGRTLVLPPAAPWYLLDFGRDIGERAKYVFPDYKFINMDMIDTQNCTTTKVEDYINLDQLRAYVPTLTWEEFQAQKGLDFERAKAKAAQVLVNQVGKTPEQQARDFYADNYGICHPLERFQSVTAELLYMDGRRHRQGFACGDWDALGGPRTAAFKGKSWRRSMHNESWALLTHGFVWHPDAFKIASKVVEHLGIFEYNALHGRYGDFQYKEAIEEPSKIFQKWPSLGANVKVLYVATDNAEKFKHVSHPGVRLLTWDDLFDAQKAGAEIAAAFVAEKAKYKPERWFKLMGPVEELICTYSRLFVGTLHSSFTGHIQRMRLHARAPNTQQFFHSIPETPEVRSSLARKQPLKQRKRQPRNMGDIFLDVGAGSNNPSQ